MASKRPDYGICSGCGHRRALRATGTVRAHRWASPQGYRSGPCSGADHPPVVEEPEGARCHVDPEDEGQPCGLLLEANGWCVEHGPVAVLAEEAPDAG